MSDLLTAAQQALEALEQSETLVPYEGFGMRRREAERKHEAAITALRAALEQPEPVADAMKTVIKAMQADPDYAWSWHCNVAMAFADAGGDPYTANQGAARFMRLLANVDPTHELPPHPPRRETEPAFDALVAISLLTHLGGEVAEYADVVEAVRRLHAVNAELLVALKWIATVNAMDYEYQAKARIAIARTEGA